jgi:orotate phosphoribosyltransferase
LPLLPDDHHDILNEFTESGALLQGHFILSSGLHSAHYLQCALVLSNPARAARLCSSLAAKLPDDLRAGIDIVVSPAMGGVVVGYEMARQLGVSAYFTERVDGHFALRRGFQLQPEMRVFMMEDVVTTGLSSRECIACIEETGAKVIGAGCLVDRSNGSADVGVPLYALIKLDIPCYSADALPAALADLPATKPGSRMIKN